IEEIDNIDPESLERRLGHLLDVLRPTVQSALFAAIELEPELGGDHNLPAEGSEGFAHQLLVREGAVNFGGVEDRDATLHSLADQGDPVLFVHGRAVAEAHAHAAEPE